MIRWITILVLIFSIGACKEQSNKTAANEKNQTAATPPPTPPSQPTKVRGEVLYPSVPTELVASLWENCDYVDYTYDNLPLSMNRKEKRDIQHSLYQISNEPALINNSCTPLGSVLFYQNNEIALEGRIYYSPGCNYFVFLENNKPKYANFMTKDGVIFFKDITEKFSKMNQQ
ncbi:MAG: hypothetical protein AAF573_11295 [Bacteroidota bacterium]